MKLLKFRIWDKESDSFIDPLWHEIRLNELFDTGTGCGYIFQQYTGLKDKNGVEIYEGDIVEWQYGLKYSDAFEYREERFTITYCKEDAMFLGKKDPERRGGGERNWFYSKVVVGNIFEGVDK